MRKNLLLLSLATIPFFSFAQIFQEDFDGNGPGITAWTVIDADGLTPAPDVSYITNGWNSVDKKNYGGPTGNNAAISTSWYVPAGTSNDWLISPQVNISGTTPYLTWEAKAEDPAFPDGYKVMLAPNGGNTIADFTVELLNLSAENPTWTEHAINISAYKGQNIRFAFVNNNNDKYLLLVDNIKVGEYTVPDAPNCATLITPTNGETNVINTPTTNLAWTASTTGGNPTSYDLYMGIDSSANTLIGTTSSTDINITNLAAATTYYWKIIPKNAGGIASGCTVYSFTTKENDFAVYCGPLTFGKEVFGVPIDGTEPITLVNFAGIDNVTDATINTNTQHETFLDQIATVNKGSSYNITLKGNTNGNYSSKFAVFIDWNQNGSLNDAGEAYEITQEITNSDGTDSQQAVQSIMVPNTALLGNTRMRVKKIFDDSPYANVDYPNLLNPCIGGSFGQAEDYTVNVGNLAVSDLNKTKIQVYPNPVADILKVTTATNAKSITIYDISGKLVLSQLAKTSNNEVNMSQLKSGTYLVTVETETGKETTKVIKK